jgi:hypothetical protein
MKTSTQLHRTEASALLAVLIIGAILAVVTANVLVQVANRRQTVNQSAVWQEALTAAEGGVHQGVAQLERALEYNALPANPSANTGQNFTLSLPHAGGDSAGASASYRLTRNDVLSGGMLRPYYSIVSTGSVVIPGARSISANSKDVILRKLNMAVFSGTTRTATRTIEAWVSPKYNTDGPLKTDKQITLNNFKIYIDSFDSNNPNRSLPGGQPGTAIGQYNIAPHNVMAANISTNSTFISAGDATVYGDALTNGGTVGGSSGIQGEIRDDYYEPMAPVYPPDWASTVTPGIATSRRANTTVVNSAATIRGGTAASPGRYIVDSVSLAGSSDILRFDFGTQGSNPDPDKKFVELYVRGDFTTKGGGNNSLDSGSVVIVQGVQVKVWVLGSLNFSGNGMANNNSLASAFSLYGVNAPVAPTSQTFTLAGTARFYGTVYAPSADLKLAGGGSDGTFVGSLSGKTAFLNGNTNIRYDEALSGNGLITGFRLVSWFEDTKKQGGFSGLVAP